ncbi:hypothetical protein F4814DRAFT_459365 [Daldinia grandis]|nr:hypothetical protein F4814DRAFT_459365 [Daldinia grandis]
MDNCNGRTTCLSDTNHEVQDARNIQRHFFGCLEFGDQDDFLNNEEYWRGLTSPGEANENRKNDGPEEWERLRYTTALSLEEEFRRIDTLRERIRESTRNVEESSKRWRESRAYRDSLPRVSEWRLVNGKKIGTKMGAVRRGLCGIIDAYLTTVSSVEKEKENDQDQNRSSPLYNFRNDIKAQFIEFQRPHSDSNKNADEEKTDVMKPYDEPVHEGIFTGQFPDQQLSLESLLTTMFTKQNPWSGSNNLKSDCSPGILRYFHIPYNNMFWMQEAMSTYFRESDRGELQAAIVLQHERWRGQEGSTENGNVAHSRHLRPLCERFSTDYSEGKVKESSNMVLFMPYLHWETDRSRSRMSNLIEKKMIEKEHHIKHKLGEDKMGRRDERKWLPKPLFAPVTHEDPDRYDEVLRADAASRSIEDILWRQIVESKSYKKLVNSITMGVELESYQRIKPKNELAQYLLNSARLFEEMVTFQDRELMESNLFADPPLHPRRSLDQAYFRKLRTTESRDRDQVVYRSTRAEFLHKYRPPKEHQFSQSNNWKWTGHGQHEDKFGCDQCTEDISKVPRAVMVDQLWMWILDRDTILTCFPQRYGVQQIDPSGVHQSIRIRLKDQSNPRNHVRTIFDLGLIILEECSQVFFDRVKKPDKQPIVLDIFAESIGNVTNQQSLLLKRLWQLVQSLTKAYQSVVGEDIPASLILSLLDITREGQLQQEAKDIIDELDIMIYIVLQQKEMITRFSQLALEIIPKKRTSFKKRSKSLLSKISDRVAELEGLKRSAQSAARSVNDLLALKQQQVGVVQSFQSVRQGQETVVQGRAIMLFTVMTIIFLPMSFMTSLFGMNAVELTGSNTSDNSNNSAGPLPPDWTMTNFWPTTFLSQLTILLSVSGVCIFVAVTLAFSPGIRLLIRYTLRYTRTLISVKLGLYRFSLKTNPSITGLSKKLAKAAQDMKEASLNNLQTRNLQDSYIRDGVADSNSEGSREESEGISLISLPPASVVNGITSRTALRSFGRRRRNEPDPESGLDDSQSSSMRS